MLGVPKFKPCRRLVLPSHYNVGQELTVADLATAGHGRCGGGKNAAEIQ